MCTAQIQSTDDPAAIFRDWANLPADLLDCITELLSVADHIRFAAVCTSWSAASPSPLRLHNTPCLLFPGELGEQSESFSIATLSDNCNRHWTFPLPEIRGKWWIGSQYGWIATLDEFSNPSLLNPLTRSQIPLPPVTSLSQLRIHYNPNDGSISSYYFDPPLIRSSFSPMSFRLYSFRKIVLSSDPAIAIGGFAAMSILCSRIVYIRPGDNSWKFLDVADVVLDIIHRAGKFLILFTSGDVHVVDLCDESTDVNTTLLARGWYNRSGFSNRFLVDSSGDLLQVCKDDDLVRSDEGEDEEGEAFYMHKTTHIEVWRLDRSGSWIPVINLGGNSLFVGTCTSMAFSVGDAPGLERNCVYFTQKRSCGSYAGRGKYIIRDIGVYHMKDSSIEMIHPPYALMPLLPPTWVLPSGL